MGIISIPIVLFMLFQVAWNEEMSEDEESQVEKRDLKDTANSRKANMIKNVGMENFPIKKFSMGNLKHFLATYNVCSSARPKTKRSSGTNKNEKTCKCAKAMMPQGQNKEFEKCCGMILKWLKDVLNDDERIKKIWKVEQKHEKAAFKTFSTEVDKCLKGTLGGNFDVRADTLGAETIHPSALITVSAAVILYLYILFNNNVNRM